MLGNSSCFWCCLLTFFKINFSENSFSKTIRVSKGLDPEQDQHFVGPDLGPNYWQKAISRMPLARKARWAVVRPTRVYLLDFFCSSIQFYVLLSLYLCFIHAREPLYSKSAVIAWWSQSTSGKNGVIMCTLLLKNVINFLIFHFWEYFLLIIVSNIYSFVSA